MTDSKAVGHLPVLINEILEAFNPTNAMSFLDGTFGGGGHTRALLQANQNVTVHAIDQDPEAATRAQAFETEFPGRFFFHAINFSELHEIDAKDFDGILLDIGVSSFQLDDASRGFSFKEDAPLDMRMNNEQGQTASEFLNKASRESLTTAIRDYGEEKFWRVIVDNILKIRGGRGNELKTTAAFAQFISDLIPTKFKRSQKIHPATKTFQGIRIAINDELKVLEKALPKAFAKLKVGGQLAVITFHSLEDRIVKRFFRYLCGKPVDKNDNIPEDLRTQFASAVSRKPITASQQELDTNPRSRSAKLRIIKKLQELP
jgi:16S rRNA (cytosine1402-N4)-methyltransferase